MAAALQGSILVALLSCAYADRPTRGDNVNVLIGTGPHGHTLRGAKTPVGLVQIVETKNDDMSAASIVVGKDGEEKQLSSGIVLRLMNPYSTESSSMLQVPDNPMADRQSCLPKFLKLMKDFLDERNIDYTLLDGSLLGAVRQCGIFAWDYDADMIVFASTSLAPDIIGLAKKEGVYFYNGLIAAGKDPFGWLQNDGELHGPKSSWLDIHFRETRGSDALAAPTKPCELDGVEFKCTTRAQTFLTEKYGADWIVPKIKIEEAKGHYDLDKAKAVEKQSRDACRERNPNLLLAADDGTVSDAV